MKISKRNKEVVFNPRDDKEWKIVLEHPGFNEYMVLKVTYTKKGFGVQAFSESYYEDTRRRPLNIIVGERGEQSLFKETYAAIWKLTPKFARSLRKKF